MRAQEFVLLSQNPIWTCQLPFSMTSTTHSCASVPCDVMKYLPGTSNVWKNVLRVVLGPLSNAERPRTRASCWKKVSNGLSKDRSKSTFRLKYLLPVDLGVVSHEGCYVPRHLGLPTTTERSETKGRKETEYNNNTWLSFQKEHLHVS